MRVELGQRVVGIRLSQYREDKRFLGVVVYIHPSGRWITVQGPFYQEAFMMADVKSCHQNRKKERK